MPQFDTPFQIITQLLAWADSLRDWFPDFETRMINRERRKRLQHAEGKLTDAELAIELDAIEQKRASRG